MNMLKQRIKTKKNITIKKLNDYFDKMIDKSKSFEDQIKSLKKVENLDDDYYDDDFDDKELKYKYFKIKLAHLSNEIDKKLFEQIFGHTLIKLTDKLINAKNKEENQIIVNIIKKNIDKLFETNEFSDWVIQLQQRADLKYTIFWILMKNSIIKMKIIKIIKQRVKIIKMKKKKMKN